MHSSSESESQRPLPIQGRPVTVCCWYAVRIIYTTFRINPRYFSSIFTSRFALASRRLHARFKLAPYRLRSGFVLALYWIHTGFMPGSHKPRAGRNLTMTPVLAYCPMLLVVGGKQPGVSYDARKTHTASILQNSASTSGLPPRRMKRG